MDYKIFEMAIKVGPRMYHRYNHSSLSLNILMKTLPYGDWWVITMDYRLFEMAINVGPRISRTNFYRHLNDIS